MHGSVVIAGGDGEGHAVMAVIGGAAFDSCIYNCDTNRWHQVTWQHVTVK